MITMKYSLVLRTLVCFFVVLFLTRCNLTRCDKETYLSDDYNLVLATYFTSLDFNKQKVVVSVGDFQKQYDVSLENRKEVLRLFNQCSVQDFSGEHFIGEMEILQEKVKLFVYRKKKLKATLNISLIDNQYVMEKGDNDLKLALFINEVLKTLNQKEFEPIFEEVVKQQDLQNVYIY